MAKQPNTRMIGLFMLIGLLSFAVIFGIYLKNNIFTGGRNMLVMYFEESIKGLNVGSSVLFKGVEIGKVAKIELIADADKVSFSIPVFVKMEDYQGIISPDEDYDNKRKLLNELIAKGLRARLVSQSYLTGQLLIEFEMFPGTPIILKNNGRYHDVLEIPTILSPMGELSRDLQTMPIRQTLDSINSSFGELSRQLPVLLPQITKTFENVNEVVSNNAKISTAVLGNLNKAAVSVDNAAKSFENLTDFLERHPEALLRGKEKVK